VRLSGTKSLIVWVAIFSLIVASFLGIGLVIRHSVAVAFGTGEQIRTARLLLSNLLEDQLDEETGLRGYAATGDRDFLQPFDSGRRDLAGASQTLKAALSRLGLSTADASISDVDRLNSLWLRTVAFPLLAPAAQDPDALERRGKTLVDRIRADVAQVDQDIALRFDGLRQETDDELVRITILILTTAALLVAAALEFWKLQKRAIDSLWRERRRGEEAEERARELQVGHEAERSSVRELHEISAATQERRAQAQRHHDAKHDALTGLPNGIFFLERLSQAIANTKTHAETTVAVLFMDVDRFKVINDSLGHDAGDRLLRALGQRLSGCLRAEDVIARQGSDDFSIMIEHELNSRAARMLADRILRALEEPFSIDDQDVIATASIGIALGGPGSADALAILRDADIAMYRAKQLGGARYEVFASDMHVKARAHSQLELDLRRALARDELRLAYQPIASLRHGGITGFEALVRWQHPERGLVSPADFIPLAEETGLIVPLGAWVLAEACRQARTWQGLHFGRGSVSVNVNVGAKQFISERFATEGFGADIVRVLAETGLDPACLHLEITESALLDYAEATEMALHYVRSLGVAMQLDDFGTGYSSLSYLQRLPIDTVKIDLSFISGKPGSGIANPQIVQAIVALALSLGKHITAEGVETAEQQRALHEMHCTSIQGYHVSRPLDADGARAFLANWQSLPGHKTVTEKAGSLPA
jgi:diguanylate cyclase (GGDEF)-like protein